MGGSGRLGSSDARGVLRGDQIRPPGRGTGANSASKQSSAVPGKLPIKRRSMARSSAKTIIQTDQKPVPRAVRRICPRIASVGIA
jgi:hypothetical protein